LSFVVGQSVLLAPQVGLIVLLAILTNPVATFAMITLR